MPSTVPTDLAHRTGPKVPTAIVPDVRASEGLERQGVSGRRDEGVVEPRGLEPLTPCLQIHKKQGDNGSDLRKHWTEVDKIPPQGPLFPPPVPHRDSH